ncbi:MAG: NAD(P)-dependent alcohol dehydrogenase [Candidatus Nanopelagicaceae bacterium]
MMTIGFAAYEAGGSFKRFDFERRPLGPSDIRLDIHYAGICHSDIHQARGEWGRARFPMVPGHEIIGRVTDIGSSVTRFKVGDAVGVGVYIDSCRECTPCSSGMTHFCDKGMIEAYNSVERDGKTPTFGGYSTDYVLDERYAVRVPSDFIRPEVAPLLCAGITLYSPLKHWKVGQDTSVAILGLGGLGHIGVKFAAALGAHVTVISHSPKKESDAFRLGASSFVQMSDKLNLRRSFDLILNTVSADIDLDPYLQSLKIDGTLVCIGLPGKPYAIKAGSLLDGRRSLSGSMIGSVSECEEMIEFAHRRSLLSEIEVIVPDAIDEAFDRTVRSDVRYRFVIDIKSWREAQPE